jgi:hypothetical protein
MKQITCPHCGDTYPDFDVAHVCSKGPYAPRLKPKMNKRIGQLAEQAGLLGPTSRVGNSHEATEKFAELIVRECAEFVSSDRQNDEYGVFVANRIKQHFGVEE